MNLENKIEENIIEILKADDTVIKTEMLYNLASENVDDEIIKTVIQLIKDRDKSLRNSASNFLIQCNSPLIPFALIDYISSSDISIRNLAGEILLRKGVASLDAICKRLPEINDDDDIKFLIDILGLIGDKFPEDFIIDVLRINSNENVIVACIEALGNILSEKSLDVVIPFYEKLESLKPVVIEAIGKINSSKSLKFITEKFDSDDDFLKFTMIESMGEIGNEETFYFLLAKINNLKGALIWPLLEAIYKLKVKYDLDVPFDERIKKCVLDTIINSEPRYQVVAAHLVTVFDDSEILYACLSIYGLDPELNEVLYEKFMQNKRIILSRIHNVIDDCNKHLSGILDLLQNIILSDPNEISLLSRIEKQRLTESLSKSLTHPDEVVRITAAELLFRIDPETAVLFIDSMINDENFWNRMRLLDLFVDLDHPIIMEAIDKLANDTEEMVSEKAKEMALRKQYLTN